MPCLKLLQFFQGGEYFIKHIKIHLTAEVPEKTDSSLNMPTPELHWQQMEPWGDLHLQNVKFGYVLCTNEH